MKDTGFLPTEVPLEDHRQEIENRIRNLFWTVSGNYSMDIQPDVETFAVSKPLALYDAIKLGGFVQHFDLDQLSLYALKKCSLGAERAPLMELIQLCMDSAAYPKVSMERRGIDELRRIAFADRLHIDAVSAPTENSVRIARRLRDGLMRRFLNEPHPCSDDLLPVIYKIEGLSSAEDTDAIIRTVDEIYNSLFQPSFASAHGDLQAVMAVAPEEVIEYRSRQSMSDEQIKTILDEYLSFLKQDIQRLTHILPSAVNRVAPADLSNEDTIQEPEPEAAEKVFAYMERNFGKSYKTPLERERLNRQLCTGIHRRCSLYFTDGILQNPALKSTQYLRRNMQQIKNELYFASQQNVIRRNVAVLASLLKRVQTMRQDADSSRAEYGQLNAARLWKLGRTSDSKLFDIKKKREESSFVVDILLDSSSSQICRQPQIAVQGYIIAQALSEAGIPHRVSSFCAFWDYTILHRFRDYDDPAGRNQNILQFQAIGENRDGLAIRTICTSFQEREEESKTLIILSDGRPNHLGTNRLGSRKPVPYVGEDAIKDTAFEVRKARNQGISVLGIFVGDEDDLPVEKRIFGKEFVYTRSIDRFSHIIGTYLRKQMERE